MKMTEPAPSDLTPERAALHEKARAEVALVALLAGLLIPVFLYLVFADTRSAPRSVAMGVVGMAFLIPALLLKGRLSDQRPAGIALTAAFSLVAGYVTTWDPLMTAIGTVVGGVSAWVYYRLRANTNWRPRLKGE